MTYISVNITIINSALSIGLLDTLLPPSIKLLGTVLLVARDNRTAVVVTVTTSQLSYGQVFAEGFLGVPIRKAVFTWNTVLACGISPIGAKTARNDLL